MRLETRTQNSRLPVLRVCSVSQSDASNDSLDEITKRTNGRYERLREKISSEREMRRFGMEKNEYFAWRLTDYYGGDRFDEALCTAAADVLGYSTDEVKDLAQEGYRQYTLYYGEEQ